MFLVHLSCEDGQQTHLRVSIYGGIDFRFDLSLPCYVTNHDSFRLSFFLVCVFELHKTFIEYFTNILIEDH